MKSQKAILATMIAAATLLAPVSSAFAAGNTGLTIKAAEGTTLAGHTYNVYQLGTFNDVQTENGKVSSFGVSGTTESNAWAQAAIDAYNKSDNDASNDISIPNGTDAVGAIAKTAGKDTQLLGVVSQLTKAANKPAPVKADQTTNEDSITFDVADGMYLVTDSNGNSILVNTKINGMDLTDQTLGIAYSKSKVVDLDKKLVKDDGTEVDEGSLSQGDTATYAIHFTLPNTMAGGALGGKLVDNPTGQTFVPGSVTAALADGTDVTSLLDVTNGPGSIPANSNIPNDTAMDVPDGGFGIDLTRLMQAHPNKKVTIKAKTIITDATQASSKQHAKATFYFYNPEDPEHPTPVPGEDEVPVKSYKFDLNKTSASDTTAKLKGAEFKIQNTKTNQWMKFSDGKWSNAGTDDAGKEAATAFVTDGNGKTEFTGLGAGTYLVEETKAPAGFTSNSLALPSFNVAIADDGAITFTGVKNPNLTVTQDATTVQIQDIASLAQLPQTGGAWTVGFWITVGLIAGGAGFTVYANGKRMKRAAASKAIAA